MLLDIFVHGCQREAAGAGMLQNIPQMLEITRAVVDAVDRIIGGLEKKTKITTAVSYTHLDVYKRQDNTTFQACVDYFHCRFYPKLLLIRGFHRMQNRRRCV